MKATLVRPARAADLPLLAAWLPQAPQLPGAADETLLVAEAAGDDGEAALLLGSLRLRRAVGMGPPRVWYHVGCTVHAASELNLFHRQRTLMLGHDHTGASELADIVWAQGDLPLAEQAATLHLLVQSALLLMARDRGHYADRLIAELPGPRDSAGDSPFWQGLGRHFYAGDRQSAAAAHGAGWRTHVAALLPRQPIYTSFLPESAQAAIAQTQPESLLLREVLEQAGLRYGHHVNIEDAGPVLEASTDDLPTVRRSRRWQLTHSLQQAPQDAPKAGATAYVALVDGPEGSWQAARVRGHVQGSALALSAEDLNALGVEAGAVAWAAVWGGDGS